MKLKKNLLMLLILLLNLIAISCAHIPDVPICKEINPDKGYCAWTLKPKAQNFYIDEARPWKGQTWWEMRPTMILVPPSSWTEIKTYVIKQCRLTRNCRSDVGEWLDKMETK